MEELSVAPVLSTSDTHIFEKQHNLHPENVKPPVSEAQLYLTYEIQRSVKEIRYHRYKRVALQFPDDMLVDAPRVFRQLERELLPRSINSKILKHGPKIQKSPETDSAETAASDDDPLDVKLFILGDTSYGACCVDEVAAEHADADVVVHYGRSCLSPTSRIPAVYIFTEQPLDSSRLVQDFLLFYGSSAYREKLIFMADVMYQSYVPQLKEHLERHGFCNIFSTDVIHDPSSLLPNRTVPDEVKADHSKLNEWHLFHISDPPEALLLILHSRIENIHIYSTSQTVSKTQDPSNVIAATSSSRSLSRRYALLTSVATASIFGILINTLSVKNYLHVVEHVKALILAAGKKSYTFVVGKVNAAKIANFSEIGAWIVIGCWESSLIDSKGFWKPVITPFELSLALKRDEDRVWTGEWTSDFQKVLEPSFKGFETKALEFEPIEANEKNEATNKVAARGEDDNIKNTELVSEPESAPPEYDLRTGRYVSQSRPMGAEVRKENGVHSSNKSPTTSLVRRPKGDLAVISGEFSPGAEFLKSQRTWKGLGSDFKVAYEESGAAIEEGSSGVARGYMHGEEGSKT